MRKNDGRSAHRTVLLASIGMGLCAASGAAVLACSSNGPSAAGAGGDSTQGALFDAGSVTIAREGGTPISAFAFGQNYWDWADWAGDGITGITGTQQRAAALGLNVLRAGGNNMDMNGPPPAVFDTSQLDTFVAYCRAIGAEPILQVPVLGAVDGGIPTAQTAADMVTYANVTKGYGIRYWEIGNEPDVYSQTHDAGVPLTPGDFCTVYRGYVTAMKAANAAAPDGGTPMTFLGPELAFEYRQGADYLTPFLDACKDYVDIVSVHRYPFSGGAAPGPGAPAASIAGALGDVATYRQVLASLQSIVLAHARPGTPLAITEANISYDYQPQAYTASSILAASPTFYAGLWTADIVGTSLENGLWTLALFDIGERSKSDNLLGFLEGDQPVPSYYTLQMLSTTFRGTVVLPTGVPAGFSVYASYDPVARSTAVLVLNKIAPPSRLSIAIDSLPVQSFDIPALSATLVQIPDLPGGPTHVLRYTQDEADAGAGPITVQ
jgi:hypothetical protein